MQNLIRDGRFPALDTSAVPAVTAAQMRQVDQMMVEDIGVGLVQMMENAGRSLAALAMARFAPLSVTVLAGSGNNGGAVWSRPGTWSTAGWQSPS